MVPGVGFALAVLFTRYFLQSPSEWARWISVVPLMAAAVCAIASVGNLIDYRRAQSVEMFERKRRAMALTPLSAEIEAARGVHPDVIKILINERHRVWMLKSGSKPEGIEPHSVLFGAPDVTDYFLRYFLEGCTDTTIMPKRMLVEGRKNRFDPWGAVDEYTMYDRLIALLERQGKIQKWTQYEPFVWVEPWTPALVAEDFGWAWGEEEEDATKEVVEETVQNKKYQMTVNEYVLKNRRVN